MKLNLEFLMLIILAHLIADYVFQTSKMAQNKAKNIKGVFKHGMVVSVVNALILSVYGIKGLLISAVVSVSHIIIDYLKLRTMKWVKLFTIQFIIDQAIHLIVIFICAYEFGIWVGEPVIGLKYIEEINYFFIVTFFATIFVKIFMSDVYGNRVYDDGFFKRNERPSDLLVLILLSQALFNTINEVMLLIILPVFCFIQHRCFKFSKDQILFKCVIYFIIAVGFRFIIKF